jgi:EF-P beta-lysylation protein EpmB
MIPQTRKLDSPVSWQRQLSECIKDAAELLAKLGLTNHITSLSDDQLKTFPVRVPHSYVNKMRLGDVHDPLLRQVFPHIEEGMITEGFSTDPVGDHLASRSQGLLQKYQGRALLVTTGACAIHCRYCFRRHFPYSASNPLASQWAETLSQLAEDSSINEIILSGGDPLTLSDDKLTQLVADLEKIPHLKRLRIHTRLPIVLPARVCDAMLKWISNTRFNVVIVIHANHAQEIDEETATALSALHQAGCQMLNQAVLLKGVNDSVAALHALSERLSEVNVMPYYLHLLDKVQGAQHFDVSNEKGIELIDALRQLLPGYLVPRLVREQQGEASKTIIR